VYLADLNNLFLFILTMPRSTDTRCIYIYIIQPHSIN